jgi:hypothetical protein
MMVRGQTLPVSFFRHSEDQTILALHTILNALETHDWQERSFADWGVLAAPTFFGRMAHAQALDRYQEDGAWGVSPHLIPHQSLHGISGTISQVLKMHGPNLGIGGGPNPHAEAFLLAAGLLSEGRVPGLWLVLTGHETEDIPGREQRPTCHALVIAMTACAEIVHGLHLSIGQSRTTVRQRNSVARLPDFQLPAVMDRCARAEETFCGTWRLSETHWLELENVVLKGKVAA